jgi:hypothetical protein
MRLPRSGYGHLENSVVIWRISADAPYSSEIDSTRVMRMREQMRGDSMASSRALPGRGRLVATAAGFGLLVGTALTFSSFVSPDRLLERSYARAAPLGTIHLDEAVGDNDRARHVTRTAGLPINPPPPALLIDGVPVESGVLSEPLSIGTRLRLSPGSIDAREIEVLEVAEIDAPVVGLPGVRLQLVKARALDGATSSGTLRLIFTVREPDRAKVIPIAGSTSGKVL